MTSEPKYTKPNVKAPDEAIPAEGENDREESTRQQAEEQMRKDHPEEVMEREKGTALMEPGQIG